jgi:hypothetical protein
MILAHHMGEGLVPALVASGATAAPVLLVMLRARLGQIGRAFRRPNGRRADCS